MQLRTFLLTLVPAVLVPYGLAHRAHDPQSVDATLTQSAACVRTAAGVSVPEGFCINLAADSLNNVRHIAVTPAGDLLAAVQGRPGGLYFLQDANHDGVFETRKLVYPGAGNDVVLHNGYAWFTH